jgi:hemerythrin family non-heme iron protein
MGFEIPEPYCWDESFQVFYKSIDEEHKGLFKGIFDVAANPTDAGKLSHLVDIVKKHFATEEALFAKSPGYTEAGTHTAVHADFVSKISGLSTPVGADTIHFAKDWLVNHIKGTDFGYKGKLAA